MPLRSGGMRSLHPIPLVLALASALALAVPCRSAAPAPRVTPAYSVMLAEVRVFIDLANRHRAALGLRPLQWDARAARVAESHSVDMATRDYFAHTDPDGRTPGGRLTEAGVDWRVSGENIASSFGSGAEVYAAWMASPSHRATLEDPRFTRHGVGVYRGRWTHVLERP